MGDPMEQFRRVAEEVLPFVNQQRSDRLRRGGLPS